jgi:hypothetical protein
MSIAILPLVILIGVAMVVLAIVRARHPWRWVLGLTGAFFFLILGALVLSVGTWGLRQSVSSNQMRPATSWSSSSGSAGEQIATGRDGLSVRSGDNKIVIDGEGLSMTDGQSSMHISGDGMVMKQDRTESTSSSWTAARERAAQAEALAAEKARQAEERVRAAIARAEARINNQARTTTAEREPATQTDQWVDAAQVDFEADVYPSERSAAVTLARQLTKSWDGVMPPGQEPVKILVDDSSKLEPGVVQAVLQTLQKALGDGRVEMDHSHRGQYIEAMQETIQQMYGSGAPASAPAKTEPDSTVRVTVSGDFYQVPSNRGRLIEEKRGNTVEVAISGPAGKRTRNASFVNKPWVENGIDRASQQPGREQMIARSNGLCASRGEAEQKAVADAANKLLPMVRVAVEHLQDSLNSQPQAGVFQVRQIRSDDDLFVGIRAEMLRGTGIDDQFTQQLRRPYGNVWQQALLVDASDARITEYAQAFLPQMMREHESSVRQRASWVRTGGSLILLALLIAGVYVFLNAATRGYYTWALRGSMVVLVLAGAALVLLMA